MTLHGDAGGTNVFRVELDDLARPTTFDVRAPAGAKVLVDVRGGPVGDIGWGEFWYSGGVEASDVLLNFAQTLELTVSGFRMDASVLAPYAHLDGTAGDFRGTTVVASQQGDNDFHADGELSGALTVTSTCDVAAPDGAPEIPDPYAP